MVTMSRMQAARGVALITLISVLSGMTISVNAADWPQWRGLERDGKSPEKNLKSDWSTPPVQKWIFKDAGKGYSGPAIVDGILYCLGSEDSQETVFALDTRTGKRKWQVKIDDIFTNAWGDGPRSTPTVIGKHLYAISGKGKLVCLNTGDGSTAWSTSMEDLGGKVPYWGYTESILHDNGNIICTPGGSKGAIASLNAESGKVVWQSSDFTDEAQYSSIMKATLHGKAQYIQRTMKSIVGIDASNGKLLWKTDFPGRTAMIPTPIIKGNHIYITGGYGTGCTLIKVQQDWSVEEVYFNKNMKNHHGGVVLAGNSVFGYSDGVGWIMQDMKSGEEVWSEKQKLGKGAVTMADNHFYCLSESNGKVELLENSEKGYISKGSFTLSPQSDIRASRGKIWTHPVIVDGNLYLRDQDMIYCYDISK